MVSVKLNVSYAHVNLINFRAKLVVGQRRTRLFRRVKHEYIVNTWELLKKSDIALQFLCTGKKVCGKGASAKKGVSEYLKVKGKLRPTWEGLYKVIEPTKFGAYRLVTLDKKKVPWSWIVVHLRKYYFQSIILCIYLPSFKMFSSISSIVNQSFSTNMILKGTTD